MMIPKRFAVSTLLLLMLVVASVFGYFQWRDRNLLPDFKIQTLSQPAPVATNYEIREMYEAFPATLAEFVSMLQEDSEVHSIEHNGTFHPPVTMTRQAEYLRLLEVAGLQGAAVFCDRRDSGMTVSIFKSGWKNMRLVYTTEDKPMQLDILDDDRPAQVFEPIDDGWFVGILEVEKSGVRDK